MADGMGLKPGTIIGRDFRVVRQLAAGAMGVVYVVEQLSTGKQRAMKVMSIELANNDRARERFVLEARVGAGIDSDHVVEVVTAGIDDDTGVPYLVMELLQGEELAAKVKREGPLPLPVVAEILRQACHALGAAHQQGIVHRDIKPENLFIAESRREGVPFTVKILDFGIAKLVAERTSEGTQPVGTPLYMSPEQTDRRGIIGPPTDVWPLGLIAFKMLTGHEYWLGGKIGLSALLREVVIEPLAPASERAAQMAVANKLPVGFDDWFAHCVERDPAGRFPDAAACARAFSAIAGEPMTMSSVKISPRGPLPSQSQEIDLGRAITERTGRSGDIDTALAASAGAESGRGRGPLIALGAVLLLSGAAGAYFLFGGEAMTPKPEPPSATTDAPVAAGPAPSTSSAAAGCPAEMLLIKGGNMFMGSTDQDLGESVRPPHKVKVSSFCLDRREVTVAAYESCVAAGNCLRAKPEVSFVGLKPEQKQHFSALCNAGRDDRKDHPINCVDWSMADNFCRGEGGRLPKGGARLPTEAEWEFASRGSGQRTYPWGDDAPGPERLNACGGECAEWFERVHLKGFGTMFEGNDGFAATAPVGAYPKGASSDGVLDLAGNVWEWTADWYGVYGEAEQSDPKGPPSGEERVVRGGGFNGTQPGWAKPAYRWRTAPDTISHGIGFRCAHAL